MFEIYKDKKVLIFGNTGFVGSTLTLLLIKLGAQVIGYSDKNYEHFVKLDLLPKIKHTYGYIENYINVYNTIEYYCPDIIINLSAQALVRESFVKPKETYETNILGSLNILESIKKINQKVVFLNVTSDKCYKNKETVKGYVEEDELNGYDPYSNSKSCAELITQTYDNNFFKNSDILIATLRSGNIIGMGDFGKDRLIPDIMRSYKNKETLIIRYPKATRPWTYILDTITGYLKVGEKLLQGDSSFKGAWNFSSNYSDMISVEKLLKEVNKYIPIKYEIKEVQEKETSLLFLNSDKSKELLNWWPKYNIQNTIKSTVDWYRAYYDIGELLTQKLIDTYISLGR